jgi:cellulose synthase/poly-beta-1,6-N-acetylglucosamine synthase-like glycosyltransferase
MISAIGAVVPARDEEAGLEACLDALLHALGRLPGRVETAVCVVADRCRDATAHRAARLLAGSPSARVRESASARSIGEVRDLGVREVRRALAGHDPDRVWLLCTDADTRVGPHWARDHLGHADRGWHAVAGMAHLDDDSPLSPSALLRYGRLLGSARTASGHGNVYGANLGVRADAYTAVGGFRPLSTGEDHDLWRRLTRAGFRTCHADDVPVRTSARRVGRAPEGLAALLRTLSDPAPSGPGEVAGVAGL